MARGKEMRMCLWKCIVEDRGGTLRAGNAPPIHHVENVVVERRLRNEIGSKPIHDLVRGNERDGALPEPLPHVASRSTRLCTSYICLEVLLKDPFGHLKSN